MDRIGSPARFRPAVAAGGHLDAHPHCESSLAASEGRAPSALESLRGHAGFAQSEEVAQERVQARTPRRGVSAGAHAVRTFGRWRSPARGSVEFAARLAYIERRETILRRLRPLVFPREARRAR
jgi:hypothetical protein